MLDMLDPVSDYEASALSVDLRYIATDKLTLNTSLTQLSEETGLLGVQGSGILGLDGGSVTDAVTVGANYKIAEKWSVSGSATFGHTNAARYENSALAVSEDGLRSTSFKVSKDPPPGQIGH